MKTIARLVSVALVAYACCKCGEIAKAQMSALTAGHVGAIDRIR